MPSEHPSSVSGVFHRPFTEQVAFFRNKLGNLVPTLAWDDLDRSEHDSAFMIAGATKADLLSDMAAAVDKTIVEGTGIEAFRKDFRAIVAKHGWTGWTGEGSVKGEAWRVGVIYRTNMSTSYAAGRYAQLKEGKWKFWLYRHGGSKEPRPVHLSWDGIALPPVHVFWQSHYPPSDWGCSCYVLGARSERGVRRLGGDPEKALPEGWNAIDPKTGAPEGVGKGWNYAPGASVHHVVSALSKKLDTLPYPVAVALSRDWLDSQAFARWVDNPSGNWPLALLNEGDVDQIGSKVRVAHLSSQTVLKQRRNHPELSWADYKRAQDVIDAHTHKIKDSERSLVFVKVLDGDGSAGGHVLVVKATKTGEGLFVSSFRRLSRDEAKRDRELRRLISRSGN